MKFSKITTNYVYKLIENYSTYVKSERHYELELYNIPDFEIQKLASYIYIDCPDFAAESTGPDNDLYERKMLPALISFLRNSTYKDNVIEFVKEWQYGTTKYAENVMKELLAETLVNYNQDHDMAA